MKVLVIQQRMGIGDMIIFLPYVHALSVKYKCPISLLVKKNTKAHQLLGDDRHIDKIITLDRNGNNSGSHDGIKGFFKLIEVVKKENFDKVFIFNGSLRYYLSAKFSGIKEIAQYPLFKKKDNIITSAKKLLKKEIDTPINTKPVLYLNDKSIKEAKNKYKNTDKIKHICLGFSASGPTKRWNLKNYINLCEKISKEIPCKFYLAGGRKDNELFEAFSKLDIYSNCVSFQNLSIKETLPIIKNCDIYIGNDTGWLHISSALGLKCLALFMDSPVMAYGKYSDNIIPIIPDGETEETTTHNTMGKERISIEKVYKKFLYSLTN
jgi:heptosyltransferase-2